MEAQALPIRPARIVGHRSRLPGRASARRRTGGVSAATCPRRRRMPSRYVAPFGWQRRVAVQQVRERRPANPESLVRPCHVHPHSSSMTAVRMKSPRCNGVILSLIPLAAFSTFRRQQDTKADFAKNQRVHGSEAFVALQRSDHGRTWARSDLAASHNALVSTRYLAVVGRPGCQSGGLMRSIDSDSRATSQSLSGQESCRSTSP